MISPSYQAGFESGSAPQVTTSNNSVLMGGFYGDIINIEDKYSESPSRIYIATSNI